MPQLMSLASAQAPWLLPAVGIALFIHKHFIGFKEAESQLHARVKAGARSRPPKLKRKASKTDTNNAHDIEAIIDREQEQLDAAGLGHDKLVEWFTEDEVEALHQAQANPAALLSLLTGNRFAAMDRDNESEWSPDEGSDQGLSNHILQPRELLQDSSSGSPMSGASSEQHELAFQHEMQQQLQQQQQRASEEAEQQQSLLAQQLFLHLANAELQHAEQQQKPGGLQSPAAVTASTPQGTAALGTAAESCASGDSVSECADSGDYFNPNDYFALSPAPATAGPHLPSPSPGHFMPRAGALWATSYPPRLGEDFGNDFAPDFVPDFEPDLGDLDWDFDAPDFDLGYEPDFDDDGLVFDVEGLGQGEADCAAPVAAATQVV